MRKGVVVALAVIVLAVLSSGIVGVAAHDSDEKPRAGPATTSSTTTLPSPPGPGAPPGQSAAPENPIDATVTELRPFVERERGLAFKQPVKVTLLDDKAFRARVTEGDEEDEEEVRKAEAVLRAMGLLGGDVDLVKALDDFAGAAVAGSYDPDTDELLVRGGKVSPFVKVVLVHELVHALEDQHFNLSRDNLEDEASIAFSALAEGSALRIEESYADSLSTRDQFEAGVEEARLGNNVPEDLPEIVRIALGFPYREGPGLVRALIRAGGQARLDTAFATPPASTEHVISPQRYLNGDPPRPVAVPRADGPPFDDGEIGQLFLILMLRSELDNEVADAAAEGWGGDRYVAWKDGRRTCVRMDFVMDTTQDTDELVRALAEWSGERPPGSTSVSGSSVTTCG